MQAEAPPVQGTLPEDYLPGLRPLLKEAVERSPSTLAASISVAQAEAGKLGSRAALYPQLLGTSQYASTTESTSQSTSSTSKGLFYEGSLSQPIFQWGALKNGAEVGTLGQKIAERQYAEAYRLLAVSIREQYMGLIQKNIQVRNALFSLKLSQESLAVQQAKFESGAASEADLGNYRIAVQQSQLDADRAQEEFDYGKRLFTRLVGIDDIDDASIPLMVPHAEYSKPKADSILAGFVGNGIESTFQNEVYKLTLKQADLNYTIASVRLLPKLNATASYAYENYIAAAPGNVEQVGLESRSYAITGTWFIFDGFATRAAKLAAKDAKRLYERQRKTYVDTTIDSITYLRHQIDFASRSMAMAEVRDGLIEAEVKRFSEDLGLGYASQATIDSGKLTLYSTEYLMAFARADYLGRWSEFVSLAGVDPALDNISPRYVR